MKIGAYEDGGWTRIRGNIFVEKTAGSCVPFQLQGSKFLESCHLK